MTEQTITRTQVIVVNEVGQNSYNDLTFTDQQGGQYKISAKRRQYFDNVIVAGAAVQLNYTMSSFGKEYVYSATQVKEGLPPPKQAAPVPTPDDHLVKAAQAIGAKVIPDANEIKNRSVAIAYAKDAWCAGKIEAKDITAYADRFLKYMKGE